MKSEYLPGGNEVLFSTCEMGCLKHSTSIRGFSTVFQLVFQHLVHFGGSGSYISLILFFMFSSSSISSLFSFIFSSMFDTEYMMVVWSLPPNCFAM